jgi:hypothetical protein
MPFAATDGFWKIPNFFDVLGVAGFVVGVGSVWLSWYLAKRDIRKRIDEAQRAAFGLVDRVTTVLVQSELSEALRCLRDTREAVRRKDWSKAMIRMDDVEHHLSRVQGNDRFTTEEADVLQRATDDLTVLSRRIGKLVSASEQKDTSPESKNMLEKLITAIGRIDTRLRGRLLEGDHV